MNVRKDNYAQESTVQCQPDGLYVLLPFPNNICWKTVLFCIYVPRDTVVVLRQRIDHIRILSIGLELASNGS